MYNYIAIVTEKSRRHQFDIDISEFPTPARKEYNPEHHGRQDKKDMKAENDC